MKIAEIKEMTINDLVERVEAEAVSYTHLDVYKRQLTVSTTVPVNRVLSVLVLTLQKYSRECAWADNLVVTDRKSTRLNSSHSAKSRMPSSA